MSYSVLSPVLKQRATREDAEYHYIPLSYRLLSPRVTGMAAEEYILYIPLSYSLLSTRVTGIDAEDYTTHTFFV